MNLVPFKHGIMLDQSVDAAGRITHNKNDVLRGVCDLMEEEKTRSFVERNLLDDPEPVLLLMWIYSALHKNMTMATKYEKIEMLKQLLRNAESRRKIMEMRQKGKSVLCRVK